MWWLCGLAGAVAVATGLVGPAGLAEVAHRAGPVLAFLLAVTVVAELADAAGVFDAAARLAARGGRGRTRRLWLLVVLLGVLSTVVLSLDTTAVLLTPVVLALAAQLRLDPLPFAMTTVWLANTASLLLPVSNLTNLIALDELERLGVSGTAAFTALTWAPFLAGTLTAVLVLGLAHRGSLRGGYGAPPPGSARDPVLFGTAALVCCLLAPAFVSGVEPAVPAAVAALVLVAVFARRRRAVLRLSLLPWRTVVLVAGLFLVVEAARAHGLDGLLRAPAGTGEGLGAHLRLAATAAVGANALDNLPAYLAVEPLAGSAPRLVAVLAGVNLGPLVTPWASLATLLWLERCRARGVRIALPRFAALGAVGATACTAAAVLALQLTA
ncbi:SLC13 family permease [Kineococcus indalonis]|uniref:SLC13 family permease n=1 Tax=Kineococcus indalonis TaxID=2696566 RepID=UPI001411F2D0|nr:SLC13 family permease [Kineococcus indalonis]NAZ85089.1 arsenic transporter [Kineococcus indalonis]